MNVLDVSYGVANITEPWIHRQIERGWTGLVCNLWTGAHSFPDAEKVLRTWRESGGKTAGYLVIHDFRPAWEHVKGAMYSAGSEWSKLSFVAIDIEQVSHLDPLDQQVSVGMVEAVKQILTDSGVRKVIIYSSKHYWKSMLQDTPDFADLPLWDSNEGNLRTPNLTANPGYGGWSERAGHQFWLDEELDGVAVDMSVFEDAVFAEIPSEVSMQTVVDSLNLVWNRLDRIQKAAQGETIESIVSLAEEAKQLGVVEIKKSIGLQ